VYGGIIMKKSDYNEIIKKLSNPDTVADAIVELSNQLDVDEKSYNNLVESNNKLRDANSQFVLKLTNVVQKEDVPDPETIAKQEAQALEDEFLGQFKKED
jgi:hypothetical protein